MIERDNLSLLKLCSLINKQRLSRLAYSRAQYKVSYYRKIKARLEKNEVPPGQYTKWKNNHLELAKKIELARLTALKRHSEVLKLKQRFKTSINRLAKKLNGELLWQYNAIVGVAIYANWDPHSNYTKLYNEVQITEMAAQYEAITAMDNILKT